MSRPHLGIVIPAYNEEARIGPTLERVAEFLTDREGGWTVTVVDDGSTDKTAQIVREFAMAHPQVRLLSYEPNHGKGYAVRKGMMETDAGFLLLSDADLAAPIEEVEKLFAAIADADVAIGSRPLKESRLEIRQPWYREMLGRAFNLAVQTLAVPGIKDTQCGFKLFRQDIARDVFSRCKLDGFGFDFEALMICRDLGRRISEVPVRWSHQEGSKVVLSRDGPRMLADLVRLRLRGKQRRIQVRAD
ncbi:MAG: dolichyl-phosphate beta-glucosyltransferase [Fimbriimonadaceae bacterium]